MDENTLNDLLECSVCLERLDTSSKVLPCQHTFCRNCLEVIVSSRHELRCPECRVLVDIKIDDLPPNVLLMRILEGMKNAAAKTQQQLQYKHNQHPDQTSSAPSCKLQNDAQQQMKLKLQQQKQLQYQQHLHNQQPTLAATATAPPQQQQQQQYTQPQRRCILPHAYALFDFVSTEINDLNFKKGDLILLKRKIDTNWYVGQLNGKEGTFPINYVQVIAPLPTAQCIALYDFKMGPNEEEGCLSFQKGTVIQVLRRVDHNWAEGRIGVAIGIFPVAFVEMNALAKQLLDSFILQNAAPTTTTTTAATTSAAVTTQLPVLPQQQQQQQQEHTSSQMPRNLPPIPSTLVDPTTNASDSTTSPSSSSNSSSNNNSPNSSTTTCSSNTSSNSITSTPNQSQTNTPQHTFNIAKRHSLNALLSAGTSSSSRGSSPSLSVLQTNRHSAEILSVPHEMNAAQNLRLRNGRDGSCFVGGANDNHTITTAGIKAMPFTPPTAAAAPQTTPAREQQQQHQHTHARVNVLKTNVQQNIPPTLPWGYLALYPYKPRKSDELELKKGCVYIVTERCLDGWFKGKNWQDISGVFPGNYVTPLRQRDQQQLIHQWKYVPLQQSTSPINVPATINLNQLTNPNNITATTLLHQPPDLPPRQLATTTTTTTSSTTCANSSAVWMKPLGQTVEAFFNRPNNKRHSNEHSNTPKDTKDRDANQTSSSSSSSSAAVNLMKRLAHMKTHTKSPNTAAQQQLSPMNSTMNCSIDDKVQQQQNAHTPPQLHYVHVRSGSCPSQLLQSLPMDSASTQMNESILNQQSQQQQQQQQLSPITYGSQRVKGNKERPQLQNIRQSMDGTLRNLYNGSTTISLSPSMQQQQQQQQQINNQMNTNMSNIIQHRKSQSLDANSLIAPTIASNNTTNVKTLPNNITTAAIVASATTKSTQNTKECRFRCVVPYPPNSEIELELHTGDIIYVQRKQKNGWYKGTHARTKKTGLFPASFVEPVL